MHLAVIEELESIWTTKNKHKKIIYRLRFTMKHIEKPLDYARQYLTMSAKEWRKVVSRTKSCFADEKKFNLDGQDGFQKYEHAKIFPEENYLTRLCGGWSLMIWEATLSSGKLKLQFFSGRYKSADYVKMLSDLSPSQERRREWEEMVFQQDNAAIHNASITKKYLLEQKRLLDHPGCSVVLNPKENLLGLTFAKVYEGGRSTVHSNFMGKYIRFNYRNYLIVCQADFFWGGYQS